MILSSITYIFLYRVDDEVDDLSSDIDSESDSEDRSVPKMTDSNSTSNSVDDNKNDSDSYGSNKITENQGITSELQQTSEREDVSESCGKDSKSVNEESPSSGYLIARKTNKT